MLGDVRLDRREVPHLLAQDGAGREIRFEDGLTVRASRWAMDDQFIHLPSWH
jgi:hypothetical protein